MLIGCGKLVELHIDLLNVFRDMMMITSVLDAKAQQVSSHATWNEMVVDLVTMTKTISRIAGKIDNIRIGIESRLEEDDVQSLKRSAMQLQSVMEKLQTNDNEEAGG